MSRLRFAAVPLIVLAAGCGSGKRAPAKAPRPVSVLTLRETDPRRLDRVAASVSAWKTEDFGFEVAGRLQFVVEPDTHIEGRVLDAEGRSVTQGTLLARLDLDLAPFK